MLTTPTLSPAGEAWLTVLSEYRQITPEMVLSGYPVPDIRAAVMGLIESGETAWSTPEFEEVICTLLREWAYAGRLIRVTLTAQWLLTTTQDAETLQWLKPMAEGEFWDVLDDYKLRRSIVGCEADFLYPLQINRIIYARQYWAAHKAGTVALLTMQKTA